ncbi:hypothetical protein ACU8YE_19035 [Ralstonia sp. VS2407]
MPNNLREAILTYLAGRHEIFGSDLGVLIKKLAPGWNLKTEYRSLRAFVEEELGDVLENVGKQGGNDIYRNKTYSPSDNSLSGDDRTLWSLFSNPQRRGRIFLRGDELLAQDEGTSAPEGAQELQRIKASDYATLLLSSVGEIPADLQDRFNAILSSNETTPWSEVLNLLRKTENTATSRVLEQKRVQYVVDQFKEQLRLAGCTEERVGAFAQTLTSSKARRDMTKASAEPITAPTKQLKSAATSDELDAMVRNAAKKAIDQMPIDQIRALNLPMGLIIDALLSPR